MQVTQTNHEDNFHGWGVQGEASAGSSVESGVIRRNGTAPKSKGWPGHAWDLKRNVICLQGCHITNTCKTEDSLKDVVERKRNTDGAGREKMEGSQNGDT